MLLEFEKKITDSIEENGLFSPDNRILLAVSGGADSTSLMYAMCALKANDIFSGDILCAHINHQLRAAESDGDEAFVIEQADELNLAVTTRRLDVRGFARENKLSIETAARKLRIESLLDIAKANQCRCVATAHQKDDNAETIIQRLIRGAGFRGLGGIWPKRSFADGIEFVRPLLCVRRDEIIEYLKQRNLKWRTDRMNEDCSYRRSFIRHQLIPELQRQCNGSLAEQLFELAQSSRRFYTLVRSVAEQIWPNLADCDDDGIALALNGLSSQHPAVKVEIIRWCLTYLGSGERDLTEQHYERVLQLAQQNVSGRKIELPGGFVVQREYDKLIFTPALKSAQLEEQINESIEIQVPGQTKFGRYFMEANIFEAGERKFEEFKMHKTNFVEWFDFDKVAFPLTARFRRLGDKFWPLGAACEKKVGKFLTSAKVPQKVRKKVLIITDRREIIWLWPVRISEHAKVTAETRKILQVQITGTQ
jgi:tRNA(Ile)-lysidine synthase